MNISITYNKKSIFVNSARLDGVSFVCNIKIIARSQHIIDIQIRKCDN